MIPALPLANCHHRALSPHVGAWHRAGPAECNCSPSRSCARCVTSSASGRTYAAHSVDCSTDAAAVQPTASRWCDNLEREPEREPECGPSHVPLPQPDSWSRTRSWRCRRWRLPKRRSLRRIRKSSGRRGGRAGAEAEEGDEPGCEGVEALGGSSHLCSRQLPTLSEAHSVSALASRLAGRCGLGAGTPAVAARAAVASLRALWVRAAGPRACEMALCS